MRFYLSDRRGAFTLLEVVVGLALMASVLVGSLLSFSAHHQQRRTAEAKIAAVDVADQILNEMSESRAGIPLTGRGLITGKPNWFWRTSIAGVANPAQTPLRVIRFQVIEVNRNGRMQPLMSVDVVEAIEDE